jgi:hypothetical protein
MLCRFFFPVVAVAPATGNGAARWFLLLLGSLRPGVLQPAPIAPDTPEPAPLK